MLTAEKYTRLKPFFILLCAFGLLLLIQSCHKKRSDLANALYGKGRNKVFKKLDPQAFASVFDQELKEQSAELKAFYQENDDEPVLVLRNFKNDNLKTLAQKLSKSGEHGLDPALFDAPVYNELLGKFYDPKAIKTTDEAYHDLARLELMTAKELVRYSKVLQYGLIDPKTIYKQYDTQTREPDSTFAPRVLNHGDLQAYLDSIQPKNPQYKALQTALASGKPIGNLSAEESRRVLTVALERLRWQNKPQAKKYVLVNIPDFRLDIMENGQSVLDMKVCVGKGRNMDFRKTLVSYADTDRVDHPTHETPMLNSMIYEVQVNPVWNIPQSIASKEIIVQAKADPYYLSNNNIDVYQKGRQIDPDSIDWSAADAADYSFKQEPGADNSLGKLKFLFKNKRSIYLHDTPVKSAFAESVRAVSHGCVRVEKPLELARALFGDGPKYNLIQKDYAADKPDPTDIALPARVPVYITYVTCWPDSSGVIQYRRDVYGLDIVLYAAMEKQVKGSQDEHSWLPKG
jgi:murein L,D-transpeptidase YcbB/YkuD